MTTPTPPTPGDEHAVTIAPQDRGDYLLSCPCGWTEVVCFACDAREAQAAHDLDVMQ